MTTNHNRLNAQRARGGFSLFIDGKLEGGDITLADAKFIAGELWNDTDRVQVFQNDAEGRPMNNTNHAGSRFI